MPYNAAQDPYQGLPASELSPANLAFEITPSDTVDLGRYAKALRVNGAGSVKFLPSLNDDTSPITIDVQAGEIVPIQTRRVFLTGTSATGIIGLSDILG